MKPRRNSFKWLTTVKRNLDRFPNLAVTAAKQLTGEPISSDEQQAITQSANAYRNIYAFLSGSPHALVKRFLLPIERTEPAPKPPEKKEKAPAKNGAERKRWNSFYSTETWKRLRYAALVASDGRCQCCGSSAADGATLRVDHIKPISKFPHLKADPDNLEVLCNCCNWGKGSWDQTDWRSGRLFPVANNGRTLMES